MYMEHMSPPRPRRQWQTINLGVPLLLRPSFLLSSGLWSLWVFSQPFVVCAFCCCSFLESADQWLVVGETDLSWLRAAPQGLGRNTHERSLIKKSSNEDKCFWGSRESAGPWRSQNTLRSAFCRGGNSGQRKYLSPPFLFISHGTGKIFLFLLGVLTLTC